MARCEKIRGKRRKVCIADLDRLITLQNRSISAPSDGVDYTMLFNAKATVDNPTGEVWAMIESVSGEEIFDQHNVGTPVTHKFYIRYDSTVTAETWVLFEGDRYDILDVEDLDLRHDFQILRCNRRGPDTRSNNAI